MDIVKKTQKKVKKSKKKLVKTIALKSYKKLAVNFLILSINLIIIILYFVLSKATVSIVPAKDTLSHSVTLPISASTEEVEGLTIPGEIATVPVEASQTFPIEGTTAVPAQATGEVTIINTTPSRRQIFVANTRFVNEAGIEIKISEATTLAPGESVVLPAFASVDGPEGEVDSNAGRFQVAALPYLEDQIYAEVTTPFTGGVQQVRTVTQEGFNQAKETIEQALKDQAYALLQESYTILPEIDQLGIEITELSSTANPGDQDIPDFTITAKATGSMFIFNEQRADEIVKQQLIKNIPPDKILVDFDQASFNTEPDVSAQAVKASISAQIQQKIPERVLDPAEIIGMNETEVEEYFTRVTGIRDVEVQFSPFWVRSVPNLEDHVLIEIKK